MKLKQRALSILLSLVMVLTFIPAMAFAGDDPADETPQPAAGEVQDVETPAEEAAPAEETAPAEEEAPAEEAAPAEETAPAEEPAPAEETAPEKKEAAPADKAPALKATRGGSITLDPDSETYYKAEAWYNWETGEYEEEMNDNCCLWFNSVGFDDEEYDESKISAVSSNESVAGDLNVEQDYIDWFPKGAGTAIITYTNAYGASYEVEVRVEVTHHAEMYLYVPNPDYTGSPDEDDYIKLYETTFNPEYDDWGDFIYNKEVYVDGKFADQIHEEREGDDILDIDLSGYREGWFSIRPKANLSGAASTKLVATDLDGNRHELTVNVTQEFLDTRADQKYLEYLKNFMEGSYFWVNDTDFEIFVPFEDYNNGDPEWHQLEDWKITSSEIKAMTGKVTVGGKDYPLTRLKREPSSGFWAIFEIGKKQAWGAKYELTLSIGGVERTIKGAVKKDVTPKVTVKNLTYNGKKRTPSMTVKYGSTTLKLDKDYYYWEHDDKTIKNVGTYKIYISTPITSKYEFWVEKSFKVNPKGTTIYTPTKGKKSFTVKWKKQTAQTTGYQIQYCLKKSFKGAKSKWVKNNKTTKATIKSLKSKKTYYVRVRTYKTVKGKKYYSSWSKVKTVKTK